MGASAISYIVTINKYLSNLGICKYNYWWPSRSYNPIDFEGSPDSAYKQCQHVKQLLRGTSFVSPLKSFKQVLVILANFSFGAWILGVVVGRHDLPHRPWVDLVQLDHDFLPHPTNS